MGDKHQSLTHSLTILICTCSSTKIWRIVILFFTNMMYTYLISCSFFLPMRKLFEIAQVSCKTKIILRWSIYLPLKYWVNRCQWLTTGWWFSLGTPVSSTNKTARHDVTEILLKVALNTINQPNQPTLPISPLLEMIYYFLVSTCKSLS